MTRTGGMLSAACLSGLVLLAGCGAPPSGVARSTAWGGAAPTSASPAAPSPGDEHPPWPPLAVARTATPPEPFDASRILGSPSRQERAAAEEAWEVALASIEDVESGSLWLEARTHFASDSYVYVARTVRVDAAADRVETITNLRAELDGKTTDTAETSVTSGGHVYVQVVGTDSGPGSQWIRDPSAGGIGGIPLSLGDTAVVPEELTAFRPFQVKDTLAQREISGVLPVREALVLMGLGELLVDEDFSRKLSGVVLTSVTVDDRGHLIGASLHGEANTVTSEHMPPGFDTLLRRTGFTLVLDDVDEPVDIEVPTDVAEP